MAIFDGTDFKGSLPISGEGLPSSAGVYLICTESAGGIKILGVYEGADMLASMKSNPKSECWKKHEDKGLDVYYFVEDDPSKRERLCRKTIDGRWYDVVCNDPPMDDF